MSDRRRWRLATLAFTLVAGWSAVGFPDATPSAEPHSAVGAVGALGAVGGVGAVGSRDSLVELGRALFFDKTLSEPPGTSCASCHDPDRAFSGSNGSQAGVPRGSRPAHLARRSSPSLLYLKYTPRFQFLSDDDDAPKPVPIGGFFWDGRANDIAELVRQPLLNPDEMNNRNAHGVAIKIEHASYAEDFRRHFGPALSTPDATLASAGQALEAFLISEDMAPFSSRYDAFVRGRGKLTPYEMQGLRLFKDFSKGGCIACHRFYDTGRDPSLSMFTDYGYDAVGVPQNDHLPTHRKPDLGLCERTDRQTPSNDPEYCARFRTPSLRNVAVLGSYMHNGVFTNLRDVVAFYATRGTSPKRWYKSGVKFEDVPPEYRSQVNVASIPYNRREGDVAALSDQEIDAIVAFLGTLTDARYEQLSSRASPPPSARTPTGGPVPVGPSE